MNSKQQRPLKKLLGIRGMGAALTAFVGLIIIYIAFGIINPAVFSGQNMLNLLRSMSKYLLIGIAQSYVLITGNIDLSIGSMVGMSAMISAIEVPCGRCSKAMTWACLLSARTRGVSCTACQDASAATTAASSSGSIARGGVAWDAVAPAALTAASMSSDDRLPMKARDRKSVV